MLGNLYLVTLPRIADKNTEIEDLLDKSTVDLFNKYHLKSIKKITDKYKNQFSETVYSHYGNINFEKIEPLLQSITDVIEEYESSIKIELMKRSI